MERFGDESGERIFFGLACHSARSVAWSVIPSENASPARTEESRGGIFKVTSTGSLDPAAAGLGMMGFLNLVSQARPSIVVEFDLSPAKARDRAPAMLERKFFNLLR